MKKLPKPKLCRQCGKSFQPFRSTGVVCSPQCGIEFSKVRIEKKNARAKVLERRERTKVKRKWKVDSRTLKEWTALAQAEFNKFIRLRDAMAGYPCISSGVQNPPARFGGAWDAGHFLSVGSHPELRFNELNCHRQSKTDNAGSAKFSAKARTVSAKYRENLIARIGLANVEWLEGPHEPKRYRIPELEAIRDEYRAKWKALQA